MKGKLDLKIKIREFFFSLEKSFICIAYPFLFYTLGNVI